MEHDELENQIKLKIADVIIKLNVLEFRIKKILSKYINSSKNDFIETILLNNLMIPLSTKIKLLKHIYLENSKKTISKELNTAFQIVLNKRNIIAHSESLLDIWQDLEDVDFEYHKDAEPTMYGIFSLNEPFIPLLNNDKIDYESFGKIVDDFNKYYNVCEKGLEKIENQLFPKT